MVMDKKVYLVRNEQAYGSSAGTSEKSRKLVWSCIGKVYSETAISALAVGLSIEKTAKVSRKSFESDSYTHVEIDGKQYLIKTVNGTPHGQTVTLMLSRG